MKQYVSSKFCHVAVLSALLLCVGMGTAAQAQTATLAPAKVVFGPAMIGQTVSGKATLSNTGAAPLNLANVATSGDSFSLSSSCGSSLAPGARCVISLTFAPTTSGALTGSLIVTDDAGDSPQTVVLAGTGIAPTYLSAVSLPFGSQALNTASAVKTVTVTNRQTAPMAVAVSISGDYTIQTNDCGTSIAASSACAISVAFTPSALGNRPSTMTVTPAVGPAMNVNLTGTGIAPFTLSPTVLAYGNQADGTTSAIKTVTVKNTQTVDMGISNVAINAPFALTNACPDTLAAGTSCTFGVTFAPTATGYVAGSLTFSLSNGGAQTVKLSGTGIVAYTIAPATVGFGNIATGTTSAAKTITVKNNQTVPLGVSDISIAAPYALSTSCPASLAAGASCTFGVTFTPTANGVTNGTLSFVLSNGNTTQSINLTGNGIAPFTLTPSTILGFSNVATGTTSPIKTITLKNSQTVAMGISDISVAGPYALASSCPASLAAGASCNFGLTFSPTALGSSPGAFSFTLSNGGVQTVSLVGSGISPFTLTPTVVGFGNVATSNTSAAKNVTLKNNQTSPLGISSISIDAPYALTTSCPASLSAGASCTFGISFTPATTGTFTDSLSFVLDNGGPQSISLSGSGVAPVVITPASINFGPDYAGTATAQTKVTIRNNQVVPLAITGVSLNGPFTMSNGCGSSLAAGAYCQIGVAFEPTVTGVETGSLTITDDWAGSPTTVVNFSGSGLAPINLAPVKLKFGSVVVGSSAAAQSITVKNNTKVDYAMSGISATGDFSQTNDCPDTLAAGTSCTVNVVFSPTTAGSLTGSLTVGNGSPLNPLTAYFSGTGTLTLTSINVVINGVQNPPARPEPGLPGAPLGWTPQCIATATYNDGSTADVTSSVTWSSSAPNVATVSSTGLVATLSTGTVAFTATQDSVQGSASMYVADPVITAMAVTPVGDMAINEQRQFHATATMSDSTTRDETASASWSFGGEISSISANNLQGAGIAVATAAGTGTAQAMMNTCYPSGDCPAVTGSAAVTVDVAGTCPTHTVDMKLLVVSNGGAEVELGNIKQILDYVGEPYTVLDFAAQPSGITADMLSDGNCHGYFQGVIFVHGEYIYAVAGMDALNAYERSFQVRQVNWYTFPNPDFGFDAAIAGTGDTETGTFQAAGATVFPYVNTANPLSISGSWTYLAPPGTPDQVTTGTVTPLMLDASGYALSLIYDFGDGRQYLTQTFDTNSQLTHGLVLAYGLVNWVTKGTFLGEYHVYAVPQVDDIFMHNDDWQFDTPCPNTGALPQFRLAGSDWDNVVAWQTAKQQNSQFANWTLQMAFVGSGATGDPNVGYGVTPDDLTPEVELYANSFNWISHTWDHTLLDSVNAAQTDAELLQNNAMAGTLVLPNYNPGLLVTPAITGLNNPDFINEAVADGVQVVVSDTTVLNTPNNGPNPSPNVGIVNTYNNALYEVPRHATNLFYNVSTPDGWTAEYQCIYPFAPYNTYTYQNILDNVSQTLLTDMLTGDMDPQMFHESNLRNYDGNGHALLFDLYDETFNNYISLMKLPVLSPTLDVLAQNMKSRNDYNLSGVTASFTTDGTTSSVAITIPSSAPSSTVTVPVTGLNSAGAESYGGAYISHIAVGNDHVVILPVQQ